MKSAPDEDADRLGPTRHDGAERHLLELRDAQGFLPKGLALASPCRSVLVPAQRRDASGVLCAPRPQEPQCMRNFGIHASQTVRRPVPRGIANSGPPLLSYGFRPFFLLAGVAACFDMIAWIGALSGYWDVGGPEGPVAWHAHEMLFGYAAAALCGFILTAVPNWTGRLPVSGVSLLGLVL